MRRKVWGAQVPETVKEVVKGANTWKIVRRETAEKGIIRRSMQG